MATSTAAAASLSLRHVFGVNVGVSDNLSFTDEDTLVYVAGHNMILYSLTEKRQRFLQSSEILDGITAYTSGPGKRLAAVAERAEKAAIHVFDLRTFRRKKTLATSDLITRDIICLQFSEDNQLLLALTGAPDWTLMVWNWARAKLVASTCISPGGSPLYKCMFSPIDASVAVVIGKDTIKFFRIGEREIRPLQENPFTNVNFTCFSWMRYPDDHLLAGSDDGRVFLFRSGEFISILSCSPGPNFPISSILCIPGGFVCGGPNGSFYFCSIDESKDQGLSDNHFKNLICLSGAELTSGNILSMAIDPKDERVAGLTSDGQLITAPCTAVQTLGNDSVKYVCTAFHGPRTITGLDVAIRKPLFLTCSKDSTLRLWNIKTHSLELSKAFPEDMYSVAMHPTGLHCAVGFTDKLRAFHILVSEFRQCMEVPIKACRECKFSAGGNYLAAANGNAVSVFDFYTGDKVADLRGHNSKVRSLHWMPSGSHLLTCGAEGAVYLWSLDGAKRIGEYVQKGTIYTSVANTTSSAIVVGNDRSLRELTLNDLAPSRLNDAGLILTNISISSNKAVMFASTYEYNKPGFIRAYPYPLSGDFDDYPCTSTQILRMRLTADENFMIVVDDNGCICLMELRGRQDRFQRTSASSLPELLAVPDWSEEIIVTKAELDDCNSNILELETKVKELKTNNEYQLKLRDMNYADKIKETTDKFLQELEIAKSRYEMLQEVRVDYEIEAIEKLKYMEEMHQNNVQNVETGFQAQIMELVDKYQKLVKDRDGQLQRLDEQRKLLVWTHERYVEELTKDYDNKLSENQRARMKEEEDKIELEKELYEVQNQLEDDIDTEIDNMRRKYESQLQLDREATMKFKQENGTLKKKIAMLQRSIEDGKDEVKVLDVKEKELLEQIKLLEKEVTAHKTEIRSRDRTINEKEKRIYDLKKKNQELDKFKFVLDFKIRELKQQIEPRQKDIMDMRAKIAELDEKLAKYHKSNSALDQLIGDMRHKIDEMQKDVKMRRIQAKKLENIISASRSDIHAAMKAIQSPPELLAAVQEIVTKYGSSDTVRPRVDPEVEAEYSRHREYLQRSISELKAALTQGTNQNMAENAAIRSKNMTLIAEINQQREINKALKLQVQADIGRIRHIMQTLSSRKKGASKRASQVSGSASLDEGGVGLEIFDGHEVSQDFLEPAEILEKNKRRIAGLQAALEELHIRGPTLLTQALPREMLPPIDGAEGEDGLGLSMSRRSSKQALAIHGPAVDEDMNGMSRKSSGKVVALPPLVSGGLDAHNSAALDLLGESEVFK